VEAVRKFPPEWPTRKAIDALTQRLRLRQEWVQDWELAVAEPLRIGEFCDCYEAAPLTLEEKFALMSLVVTSFDDYLQETPPDQRDPALQARIERLLRDNFALHEHTVEYWSRLDPESWANPANPDDPENGFLVTPLMRRIWKSCGGTQGGGQ
jgi:hypothetical protein